MSGRHYANKIQKMERHLDKVLDLCYKLNQATSDLSRECCYRFGLRLPNVVLEEIKTANWVLQQVQETFGSMIEDAERMM